MKTPFTCALSLLLASLLFLSSCGTQPAAEDKSGPSPSEQDNAPAGVDSDAEGEAADPADLETEPSYPPPDLNGLDYGGGTVSFLAPDWGTHSLQYTEDLNGDAVNDAVYNRMIDVENALNIDLLWTWTAEASEVHPTVIRSVHAGDDDYQIVYTHCIHGLSDLVTQGALYDLYDLPHTDFAAPWWDDAMMEDFRIGSKLCYAAGDLILQSSACALFNKTIAENYGLPDHYELVRNGEWTYDRFIEYASSVTLDLNGDGKIDLHDQTGFAGDLTERATDIVFFCGERCTRRGDEGLELVFWSDKMVELYEKTYAYFMNPEVSNAYFRSRNPEHQTFDEGKALYTFTFVNGIPELRDSDVEFGILPGPKYDEAQESYISNAWPCFVCVPLTIADPDRTGAALELFCYESGDIQKAYNEVLIRGKTARDQESLEMLDIIGDGMTCDIGGGYLGFDSSFHSIYYCFYELMPEYNENIASHYKRVEKIVVKTLERLYKQVRQAEKR